LKLPSGEWRVVDEVDSTQRLATELLRSGADVGVVLALHQTAGRGRFGRAWHSTPRESLTFSLIFREYRDHPRPYLIGMSAALAAAGTGHCQVRWPNDLAVGERKIGGILTEMIDGVPIVGIGLNLNQTSFPPELSDVAVSLAMEHGARYDPERVATEIVERMRLLPEPDQWSDLAPIWHLFDRTPGKRYRNSAGEEGVALGVGSDGQLILSVDGESTSVPAAEAIFGPTAQSA
jgi:BirA family transcriptional regulator, biotin operon repressor / biotin---[acetyl-CoA-carboxylase] ligase